MQRRRCRQLPKAAPAPPQLVRSSRRLPGRRRRRGGRSTEEEIQSSGSANQIGGIRGLRAALSRRRHQASRTAKLRRSAPRPEMGKPPPRQRGGPFGFVYLYIIVGVVISIIAFGLCRSGLVYSRFLVNYYFAVSWHPMALGEKSFASISWWVYAFLCVYVCVWLNWSPGICWAKIDNDNFCRNC
jgi:hypothetical protein